MPRLMADAPPRPAPEIVQQAFPAMGTLISVTVITGQEQAQAAADAIAQVERLLAQFGHDGWAWGGGALGDFNRALAAGRVAPIDPALRPLFAHAWRARLRTGGRFEPRIAALVELWGFDDPANLRSAPPAQAEIDARIAALRTAPAYDGGGSYGPAPGVGWDFGGIGKGYIVDAALELLGSLGFGDAMIDAGGNLAVRGTRGDRPWRVGIRHPRSDAAASSLLALLETRDETVNTHGDDQRFFEHLGQRYCHLLDPSSGAPAQGLRSLTVVHAEGTRAEAEGAALFVAGRDGWRRLAAELGLAGVLAVDADGSIQATAALASRLRPQAGVRIEVLGQLSP